MADHEFVRRFPDDPESTCLYCGANYFEECRDIGYTPDEEGARDD